MATYSVPIAELNRQHEAVRKTILSLALPRGVRLQHVDFRPDTSGDPAVYITYAVSRKIQLTEDRLGEIGTLRRAATNAIDALELDLLPYVHFLDSR